MLCLLLLMSVSCSPASSITPAGTVAIKEFKSGQMLSPEYYVVVLIKNNGFGTYDDVVGAFTPYNAQPLEDIHSENTNGNAVPVVTPWASKQIVFESDGYTDELIKHSGGRPITFTLTLRKKEIPVAAYVADLPVLESVRHEAGQHEPEKAVSLSFVQKNLGRN